MNPGCVKKRTWVVVPVFVALCASFCTNDHSESSLDNYYFQQAIHLSDTMFSVQKMQQYYDNLYQYFHFFNGGDDNIANELINSIFGDTLHGLISEKNNGTPTKEYYFDIESDYYVQGWKDCEPTLPDIVAKSPGDTIYGAAYNYAIVCDTDYSYGSAEQGACYRVNIIDKKTNTAIKDGTGRFGYSASQKKYIGLLRY
jgi:hypothetical protein